MTFQLLPYDFRCFYVGLADGARRDGFFVRPDRFAFISISPVGAPLYVHGATTPWLRCPAVILFF